MAYRVKLNVFEGPLDLLLFLIRKDEVDIYDIPISQITKQFLSYLDILKMLDLEGAGDFILLAATLIRIKARMLLPKDENEEDDEEEDPRQELVRRLLEYQQFKEVSVNLREFEIKEDDFFARGYFDNDFKKNEEDFIENSEDVSIFDLMSAFKNVLVRIPRKTQHMVEQFPITISDQIDYILQELEIKKQILFMTLIDKLPDKIFMIVTFIAILEMMRRGTITATQPTPFGEIWICKAQLAEHESSES